MIALLIGIFLIIAAVVEWLGHLTTGHAVALLLGAIGILLVAYWGLPSSAYARRN
jgi:hypothetical protein